MIGFTTDESARSGERNRHCSLRARDSQSLDDIFRFATGGESNSDVTGLRECRHLSVEHLGVTEIVGDARQRPTVARQRDRRKWATLSAKASHELSRQMAGLCS